MSKGLGSKFVFFYIGDDCEEVSVHQKKLVDHSKLFREAFELPNHELLPFLQEALGADTTINAENGGICLKHYHYRTRDMTNLVAYLYTSTAPAMVAFKDFFGLYYLASKFGIPELSNKVMDSIQEQHKASGQGFEPADVEKIFRFRKRGDGQLWNYCAAQVIGSLFWGKGKGEWATEFKKVSRKNPRLEPELFHMLMKNGRVIHKNEASHRKRIKREAFGPCYYHVHEEGQTCASVAEEAERMAKEAEEEAAEAKKKAKKKKTKKTKVSVAVEIKKEVQSEVEVAAPAAPRITNPPSFGVRRGGVSRGGGYDHGRGYDRGRGYVTRWFRPPTTNKFPYH